MNKEIKNKIKLDILDNLTPYVHQYYTTNGTIYYSTGGCSLKYPVKYQEELDFDLAIKELLNDSDITEIKSKYKKTRMFVIE